MKSNSVLFLVRKIVDTVGFCSENGGYGAFDKFDTYRLNAKVKPLPAHIKCWNLFRYNCLVVVAYTIRN